MHSCIHIHWRSAPAHPTHFFALVCSYPRILQARQVGYEFTARSYPRHAAKIQTTGFSYTFHSSGKNATAIYPFKLTEPYALTPRILPAIRYALYWLLREVKYWYNFELRYTHDYTRDTRLRS